MMHIIEYIEEPVTVTVRRHELWFMHAGEWFLLIYGLMAIMRLFV